MKIKLRNILIAVLAITAVICSALGLAACGTSLKSITVEGAKVEFKVGDEFETGEYFAVYANYSDGTKVNVTEEAEIKKETGFDMSVAGDYQITVSYENKKEVYTIFVGSFENVLKKLELDTQNTKKLYKLGESISFENIKITSTLENAQGNEITSTTSSLRDFSVSIENNASGNTVEEVFNEFGEYTVTISKGIVNATYSVQVEGVDISSVQSAIVVSSFFKNNIVSGNMEYLSGLTIFPVVKSFDTDYKFGKDYTYVDEKIDNPNTQYITRDDEGIFCLKHDKGMNSYVNEQGANEAMMGGPRVPLWYNSQVEYGPENALSNLYNEAKRASNKDLVETADEATRTYSFSFSGLVDTGNNRPDYYENTVSFTLSENYSLIKLEFTQKEWENDQIFYDPKDPNNKYVPTFITDEETGITKPSIVNGEVYRRSSEIIVTFNQQEGERTETSPHSREKYLFADFDIEYNGEILDHDNPVINCSMNQPNLRLRIVNKQPESADFNIDLMYFNYDGSYQKDDHTGVDFDGLNIYPNPMNSPNIIVRLHNGGVWKVYLKTKKITRTITFNVTGANPTSISPQILNEATGVFTKNDERRISINGEVYFNGGVNKYANAAQDAVVTSDNAAKAKIERVTVKGVECFKFTATEKGKYTVKISSTVAPNINCQLVIEVGDAPDYASLLKGKYTAKDIEGNVFEIEFTPTGTGSEISGTFTVIKTPTELDDTPIPDQAKNEKYSYKVDIDNFNIEVKHISGDNLAIELEVNAEGKLVLNDQYGKPNPLSRVS